MFACTMKEGEGTDSSNLEIQFFAMFQKLYKYTQGKNSEGEVIKMTVPVFSFIHLNTENRPDKSAICLWMDQENKVQESKYWILL